MNSACTLTKLAFSVYNLWSHPQLRDPNRQGFVSLSTLLRSSPLFLDNASSLTEASIVKSLRIHAPDIFEVRLIVIDKTRIRRDSNLGGYEVRRKDWAEITQRFPTFSPEYWHTRTIYIENIPISFRSIVGICNLLHALIDDDDLCIQNIFFPPHYQDPPEALPKCKGFALITLSDLSTVSRLLTRFPYHACSPETDETPASPSSSSEGEQEARRAGFRTLSKERWEMLQAEYVEYRDHLLRGIATTATSSSSAPQPQPQSQPTQSDINHVHACAVTRPWYPHGCVIFARHVPEDTNKTALRAQFSALLPDGSSSALDYVDYTKGLDTCHLRLTTQDDALSLLKRFEERREEKVITLELLEGSREEMYWENVPEKVRTLAVQRATQSQNIITSPDEDQDSRPQRKRRRR